MLRTILLAALVCASAPLSADALTDKLFEGKKPDKVAKQWIKVVPRWLNDLNASGRAATSWFTIDDKLGLYRIEKATEQKLELRELALSGELDKAGNPTRTPVGELKQVSWKQWSAAHMAATYPVETNPSASDVIAFALWLYTERDATVVGNSVLTVLHENESHAELREPIAEYIRQAEGLKKDTALATFEVWDKELRAFRKILIAADKADDFKAERNKAADARFMQLHGEVRKPETRTMTLPQLAFELRKWAIDFGDTKSVADNAGLQQKLLDEVAEALEKVAVFTKAGETFLEDKKPDPTKALAEFKKARELEPYDLRLLSQAANASFRVAHPTLQQSKSRVVGNEGGVAESMGLYDAWLLREPANVKVMLCIGQLHHLKGETDKAKTRYDAVMALNIDPASTSRARTLRKAADDNPKNEG